MNTEEDTFNVLRRTPFETVREEIQDNYEACRFNHTGISAIDIMLKHGWTYSAWMKKSKQLYLSTQ